MALFKKRTNDEMADSLAGYLPNDRLFAAKRISGTNLRKLIKGLAWEYIRANELIEEYANEIMPDTTVKFISEWESAVGIPDGCFKTNGSLDERRRNVLVKLAALGAQTGLDFVAVADLFDVTVTITPGIDSGEVFGGGDTEARFTIVVDAVGGGDSGFPYPFPIPFVSSVISLVECVFNTIKPANTNVLFREAP